MNNKVLVRLLVPELDYSFDIFIPINETVWKIKKMIIKSISDLTGGALNLEGEYILVNKITSQTYDNNDVVANTDIRNAAELLLLTSKTYN